MGHASNCSVYFYCIVYDYNNYIMETEKCQNCGHDAHCPEPLYKHGRKIKICKKCKCSACEQTRPDVEVIQ